jgi:hypothetical protein
VIDLVVSDGALTSLPDLVTITASNSYDYAAGEAYAWVAYGTSPELSGFTGFVKINLATGAITKVLEHGEVSFMAGAVFVKGRYVSVEYGTNRLFSVNGDNILYGTLYSSSGGLSTINTTTGTATLIAPLGGELDGFAIPTQPLIPG